MKETTEHFEVALFGGREIGNWTGRKKQTKHRADPMKSELGLRTGNCRSGQAFKVRTAFFERFPGIHAIEFAQLGQSRGQSEWISGQSPRLIDRALRRKMVHDFGTSAKCTHREPSSDDFSKDS